MPNPGQMQGGPNSGPMQNGVMNPPMGNQMGNQMNGQMGGNWQSQPPMMRPPKQPMDPAKKKKLIIGLSLGIGGVVVAIIGIVAVSILMRVDYGESYRVAKELKPKISDINNNNYDCSRVLSYVSSTSTSETTYNGYTEGCAEIADGVDDLVDKLGQTAGVKRDKDIKAQYDRFQEAIESILPDGDELKQRLEVYQIWHKFVVLVDDLSASKSSDAEIQSAARVLTSSGNQILATYGEGWLEKTLAYVQAYRAYYNASYSDSNKSALRTAMNERNTEQKNWVAENKPDIAEVGGLSFDNTSKMYTEFSKLYDMITEMYEKNYDDSGDCTEFLGEVFCD